MGHRLDTDWRRLLGQSRLAGPGGGQGVRPRGSDRDRGVDGVVLRAKLAIHHVKQAGGCQCLHVGVDVAVVAAKRLGQCANARHVVTPDVVKKLDTLSGEHSGQRVPALKRDMTCLDRLALLNAVPRVNEAARGFVFNGATNTHLYVTRATSHPNLSALTTALVENVPASAPPATDPNLSALPSSLDHDPADRFMDRLLARLGLLDDAAPLFAPGKNIPRAGVVLAIPALTSTGVFDYWINDQDGEPIFVPIRLGRPRQRRVQASHHAGL